MYKFVFKRCKKVLLSHYFEIWHGISRVFIVRFTISGMRTEGVHGDCWSETVRTGTKLRYALYEDLGSEVRAFRICANASEP